MTYISTETSVQDGEPILLFEFSQSETTTERFSNVGEVTWNSHTWEPAPIKLGKVTQTGEMAKNPLAIDFNRRHEFAEKFLYFAGESITTVTVYRGHPTDGEFVTYWKGRVLGGIAAGSIITVNCESIFTSLKRAGLPARYQTSCRHALYGTACGLNKASFATSATVVSATGVSLEITEAGLQPDNTFAGGMIEANGVLRYITEHTGTEIIIIRAFETIGASVTLYEGCYHTFTACVGFSNTLNYGGFPWIPNTNPFSFKSLV